MNITGRTWIKVAVVDEDPLSCLYFESLLEDAQGIECVRALAHSENIPKSLLEVKPDILLVDVGTPEVPGVTTVRRVRQDFDGLPIVMIAANENDDLLYQALCAGASGYLLRGMSPEEMLVTICECHTGGSIMNTMIAKRALNLFQCCEEDMLSEAELIVLGFLSRGNSIKQIARSMLSSLHAVKREIYRVYVKLNRATLQRREQSAYRHSAIAKEAIVVRL